MRPRYWLLTTISTVFIAAGAIAAANAALDIYGLYRPARGRLLRVVGDPRVGKYLLSMRYVPENFNAVLTGASVSANWDLTAIEKLRIYNESLSGGNIVEEKTFIEAALERPGISVAFLLVHPAMTFSHDFNTVEMTPKLKLSALGSSNLWGAYKDMLNMRLGRIPPTSDYAGTSPLELHTEMNIYMKRLWNAPDFTVDPIALREFRKLIADLRAHKVQIIFIVPPIAESLLDTRRVEMSQYLLRMHSEIGTGDLWIDFLSPEYRQFCENRANFSDGVHLVPAAARQVVAYINTAVNRWIAERRLVVSSNRQTLSSLPPLSSRPANLP